MPADTGACSDAQAPQSAFVHPLCTGLSARARDCRNPDLDQIGPNMINKQMTTLDDSTIEHARRDITGLRFGLGDLANWIEARRTLLPQADDMCQRLTEMVDFLDRLNASLEQQEKERGQLAGLFQVSRTVISTLDLAQVLDRAMDVIIQVTRAERGFLMLRDEATGELTFQVARNMDRDTIARPTFQVSRRIIQRVAETANPVVTTDALRDPRFADHDSVITLHLRSILCHPLLVKDRVIGVVYVDNRLHAGLFEPEDVRALGAFAAQAAIAIDNARLFASLEQKIAEISTLKTFQDNIFASITSGVIATDLENRITAVNRAAESILSVSGRDLIGKPYLETLTPVFGTALPRMVEIVRRAGKRRVAAEIQSLVSDRGAVNLSLSVSSLKDSAGDSLGFTIVLDDVTEKRQLEATREMFRRYVSPAVVDRLPAEPGQLQLGGHRQEVTILFADIRGLQISVSRCLPSASWRS